MDFSGNAHAIPLTIRRTIGRFRWIVDFHHDRSITRRTSKYLRFIEHVYINSRTDDKDQDICRYL